MITTGSFIRLLSLALICAFAVVNQPFSAAAAPDDQFVTIYTLSQDADSLKAAGKNDEALKKYRQAQSALLELKRANPTWNTKVVATRLSDLSAKITALTQPADEPSATSPAAIASGSAAPAKTSGTAVKLLNPGSEPRRLVRLQPKVGQIQTSLMTIAMSMEMQMGEVPGQAVKMPPMQITLETVVKQVAENGDISYESVVKDATVSADSGAPAEMVDAMKPAMGEMKGLTTTGILSALGINRDVQVKASGDSAQLQQGLEQAKDILANLSSPLPEEPIGIGARWESTMPIKSQGMTIRQTIVQEVVEMDGDKLKLSTTVTQSARNQKISNPAMPGARVDVPQMNTKGAGSTTLDLNQVLPLDSSVKANTQMTMSMNMGGQRQNMGMKMDMDVTLQQKK